MTYPVGTICIGQNFVHFPEFNGMECEILEPARFRKLRNIVRGHYEGVAYKVRWSTGYVSAAQVYLLRKKPPREDFKGELRVLELFKEKETI